MRFTAKVFFAVILFVGGVIFIFVDGENERKTTHSSRSMDQGKAKRKKSSNILSYSVPKAKVTKFQRERKNERPRAKGTSVRSVGFDSSGRKNNSPKTKSPSKPKKVLKAHLTRPSEMEPIVNPEALKTVKSKKKKIPLKKKKGISVVSSSSSRVVASTPEGDTKGVGDISNIEHWRSRLLSPQVTLEDVTRFMGAYKSRILSDFLVYQLLDEMAISPLPAVRNFALTIASKIPQTESFILLSKIAYLDDSHRGDVSRYMGRYRDIDQVKTLLHVLEKDLEHYVYQNALDTIVQSGRENLDVKEDDVEFYIGTYEQFILPIQSLARKSITPEEKTFYNNRLADLQSLLSN